MQTLMKMTIIVCFAALIGFTSMNCASRVVYVRKAPPAARVEVRPARPYAGAVWVAGYWRWNGRNYVWTSGHWVKARRGKTFTKGHWKKTPRGWRYVPGHWR